MNEPSSGTMPSARNTPAWLKYSLIVLLFGCAGTGFVWHAFMRQRSLPGLVSLIEKPAETGLSRLHNLNTLLQRPDSRIQNSAVSTITCQGVLTGENGGALVVINGEMVSAGYSINGVRIVDITSSNVSLECNGQIHRLAPGETFSLPEE